MQQDNIKYSQRTCFIYDKRGELVGKIQFQREPIFKTWRIKYLTQSLPFNSYDHPEIIREKLEDNDLTWSWGKIKHYYGYQRH
ncbi:MAG: hypothetical protein Alis3KO_03450 [Aliiglaciecola sp.]